MRPDVHKVLRKMTAGYTVRPDPPAWLVAADLLLDEGEEAEADRWRRRGLWFPPLAQAVEVAAAMPRAASVWCIAGRRPGRATRRGTVVRVVIGPEPDGPLTLGSLEEVPEAAEGCLSLRVSGGLSHTWQRQLLALIDRQPV